MCMVSIITSVYNTEEYLKKCFDSVLNQSFKDFEFIIVNNGSTDNSSKIINEYKEKDLRIKLITNKTNKFLSEARNQALDIANGKYIYIVDSDDYIEKNTIKTCVEKAEKYNLDIVVFGWIMEYYIENKIVSYFVKPKEALYNNRNDLRKNIFHYLNQSILTVPWNKLYRKDIIDKNKIRYQNTKLEDHHFNMDYIENINSCAFINDCFYHYFRSRTTSELNYIYKFDLFQKKLEHFKHTKKILELWNIKDKNIWSLVYTWFAERQIQCIQEIQANEIFTKKEKKEKIKNILNNKEAHISCKMAKPESFMMKFMIFPIKYKLFYLCIMETKFITNYKNKHKAKFVKIRAKKVNKCE